MPFIKYFNLYIYQQMHTRYEISKKLKRKRWVFPLFIHMVLVTPVVIAYGISGLPFILINIVSIIIIAGQQFKSFLFRTIVPYISIDEKNKKVTIAKKKHELSKTILHKYNTQDLSYSFTNEFTNGGNKHDALRLHYKKNNRNEVLTISGFHFWEDKDIYAIIEQLENIGIKPIKYFYAEKEDVLTKQNI